MHTAVAVQWDRFSGKADREKGEGKWPEKGFLYVSGEGGREGGGDRHR